ncbi:MAG: histone deacetylase family protein [Dehalococcoidia bacterium]
MNVVYTDAHEAYAPQGTLFDGRTLPSRETPQRLHIIKGVLERGSRHRFVSPKSHGEDALTGLHRPDYVAFLKEISAATPPGHASFPALWPTHAKAVSPGRMPQNLKVRMGYYVWDTGTPMTHATFDAAMAAVDCALTGAELLLNGERLAYALVRPPGHHADRRRAGGLCFFNNTALAARALAVKSRVAILDIDFHHGNGTQDLFFRTGRVLTTSVHGDPRIAYPFYSGFEDERGAGAGHGFNLNVPLPKETSTEAYRRGLARALDAVRRFRPGYLVVALGFDTYEDDPNGGFVGIDVASFEEIGRDIATLGLPTLLVQEGGYNLDALGQCADSFLQGLTG